MADAARDLRRYESLRSEADNYRQRYQDLAEVFAPYKANITTETFPGESKTQRLFDSAGCVAARDLSANIQGAACNAAQKWMSMKVRDERVNVIKTVRDWCDSISDIALAALANSNFYTEIGEVLNDLPVFCTAGIFTEERAPSSPNRFGGLNFAALIIGKYVIGEDDTGRVRTVFREFQLPTHVVATKWPDTCSSQVRTAKDQPQQMDRMVKIVHGVYPRDVYSTDRLRTGKGKPFASCYYEASTKTLLSEGGFDEFPFAVCRWSKGDPSTPYGQGPGWIAYPDVRTLNRYVELDLGARGKAVDPPLLQRHASILGSLSLEPAAINIVMDDDPRNAVTPLDMRQHRFDVSNDGLARLERKISEVFYGPLLRSITKDMTATEAAAIQEESMRLIGPAGGRIQSELLGQVIERAIAILFRAGQLPPMPQEMLDAGVDIDLDIVYDGPLARAQRSRDLIAIERWEQGLLQTVQIQVAAGQAPDAIDVADFDGIERHKAEVLGVPSNLILGDEQVAAKRQARAQQAAQQQKLQMLAGAAEAMGKAAPMAKVIQDGQQAAPGQAA